MISKDWATNDTQKKIKMRSIDCINKSFRVSYGIAVEWTYHYNLQLTKRTNIRVQEEGQNKAPVFLNLERLIEVNQKAIALLVFRREKG